MPLLSKDYVCRYLRTNAACRALFDRQLEVSGEELSDEAEIRRTWRHADLFLAGFPRVGIKPGYDVLCHFTPRCSNRCSGLVGYVKGVPDMVPDAMDEAFILIGEDYDDSMLFYGTAIGDQKILMVPNMPPNWADEAHEGGPDWLRHDINAILTDDGTPEGVFERAQLLLWSSEPVNRWHAIGYGDHSIQLPPVVPDESFRPVDAEGRRLEDSNAKGHVPVPTEWLPHVELRLPVVNLEGADLSADTRAAFAGKTCDLVRFYTFCEFGIASFYEVTVWITRDVWHAEFRPILAGKGGAIH